MRVNKLYVAVGLIVAFGMFFELAAHADEVNQETTITFTAPVQIPGQVLPAGKYVVIADPDDVDLVRIFNADRSVLYATLQTVPTEAVNPANDTTVTLADQGHGKPSLLVSWFYPGMTTGHELVYSGRQAQAIIHAGQETFVGNRLSSGYAGSN